MGAVAGGKSAAGIIDHPKTIKEKVPQEDVATAEVAPPVVKLPAIGDDKTTLSVPLVRESNLAEVFGIEDPKQDDEALKARQFELLRAELESKVRALSREDHHVVESTSTEVSSALPALPSMPLLVSPPDSLAALYRHRHRRLQQQIQQQRRPSPVLSSVWDHEGRNISFDDANTLVSEDHSTNYCRPTLTSRRSDVMRAALAVQQEEEAREAGIIVPGEEVSQEHLPSFPLPGMGMIVRRLSSI